jgi:hypothetical protein
VKRVEDFLKLYPGRKLQEFSASDLEAYFQLRSRDASLSAWQYRQIVDALQLLFVDLSATSLSKTLDWGYWKEAFIELKPVKPVLSKEITPDAMVADHASVKFPHGSDADDLLKAMARMIRSRHYSIRTEQSYLDWASRFLNSIGDRPTSSVKGTSNNPIFCGRFRLFSEKSIFCQTAPLPHRKIDHFLTDSRITDRPLPRPHAPAPSR